jgi:hypothetical protein
MTRGDAPPPHATAAAPQVDVPLPDLNRVDQLLGDPAAEGPVSVFFA